MNFLKMTQSKLNVFLFQTVDNQSFPYESRTYSELHIYSQNNIGDIIEFARQRGIGVFVQFDTSGHTRSWVAMKSTSDAGRNFRNLNVMKW